jgi:UDP-N-acetylglucosamine acyltransferase
VSGADIHPTAVVDPKARIGSTVRIGAYSVIGPDVTLEDGVQVGHHVVLEGLVSIGPRGRVGNGAIVGGEPQDLKFRPGTVSGVRIGADTILREYVTVHRASHDDEWTTIGSRCLLMGNAHVAHDCRIGDDVIFINYAALTGHTEVGDRVTIGGFAGGVPFTRIGAFAYVGALTKLTADVPPYCLVDGNPGTVRAVNLIGLRRAGVSGDDRRVIKAAYRLLYRSGLTPPRALERIRAEVPLTPYVQALIGFLEAARRGICHAAAPRARAVAAGRTDSDDDGEDM